MGRYVKSPFRSFSDHRYNSKRRGIPFTFTFDQWLNWWETNLGPDWASLRGTGRDQYVMARNNDSGPYSIENVKCIKGSQNRRDTIKYGTSDWGERSGKNRLTREQAEYVITSGGRTSHLAKQFGVSSACISQIKSGRNWKQLQFLA